MTQTNVRLTASSIAIVEQYKKEKGLVSFTQAINEVIANSQKLAEDVAGSYVKTQHELNVKILAMLEAGEGETVPLVVKPNGRRPKKISIRGVVYDSVKEASLKLGISQPAISQATINHPDTCFYITEEKA